MLAGVLTAVVHDPALAVELERSFLRPRIERAAEIHRRAQVRGQARANLDVEILVPALAGLLLLRQIGRAGPVDPSYVARVLDELILPAVAESPTIRR